MTSTASHTLSAAGNNVSNIVDIQPGHFHSLHRYNVVKKYCRKTQSFEWDVSTYHSCHKRLLLLARNLVICLIKKTVINNRHVHKGMKITLHSPMCSIYIEIEIITLKKTLKMKGLKGGVFLRLCP